LEVVRLGSFGMRTTIPCKYAREHNNQDLFENVDCEDDNHKNDDNVQKRRLHKQQQERAISKAKQYLDTEAAINGILQSGGGSSNIAAYLGEQTINQTRYLLFQPAGMQTLQSYIDRGHSGLQALSIDLLGGSTDVAHDKSDHHKLARELLKQMLQGIAYCHGHGVVHRDIKPCNILVDPVEQKLRLIDFGSAADMGNWVVRRGYRGPKGGGPLSLLYCAPEEFLDESHPYAFDIYSIALTWLSVIIPGLWDANHQLWDFRMSVRDAEYDFLTWEEGALLTRGIAADTKTSSSNSHLPEGWEEIFSSPEGIKAWRLLVDMLQYLPEKRISAGQALLGPYLNPSCSEEVMPPPPPKPWSLEIIWNDYNKNANALDDECEVSGLYTDTISVDLNIPFETEIVLEEVFDGRGAMIKEVKIQQQHREDYDNSLKEQNETQQLFESTVVAQVGDIIMAIGPIDVENTEFEHIKDILKRWPRLKVPLQLVREKDHLKY